VPLPLDRVFLARKLGFGRVQENPLYVQNSRGKFETFILHLLSMIQLDVNRFATDVIFFSMPETGFLELSPRICTGSSIMPHKKNPDVFEILRGMSHSAMADQLHLWSLISNLISGYHRDFQLIKPILFRQFRQTKEMLSVAIHVLPSIQVNKSRCQAALTDDLFSVHRVLERVRAGVPFRDAYREEARRWQQKDTDQNTGPDS
jgi:argininosuccinate lyase